MERRARVSGGSGYLLLPMGGGVIVPMRSGGMTVPVRVGGVRVNLGSVVGAVGVPRPRVVGTTDVVDVVDDVVTARARPVVVVVPPPPAALVVAAPAGAGTVGTVPALPSPGAPPSTPSTPSDAGVVVVDVMGDAFSSSPQPPSTTSPATMQAGAMRPRLGGVAVPPKI